MEKFNVYFCQGTDKQKLRTTQFSADKMEKQYFDCSNCLHRIFYESLQDPKFKCPHCGAYVKESKNIAVVMGIINAIPLMGLFSWLFYLLLKKRHPKKAKASLLGGAIFLTFCLLTSLFMKTFSILILLLCVAYYILYFTHNKHAHEKYANKS